MNSHPAIVLAHNRSGSQLLVRLLDSHPLISCALGEPLHYESPWHKALGDDQDTLALVLGLPQCAVSMCKVSYRQWLKRKAVRRYVAGHDVQVTHLWRENALAAALSERLRLIPGRPTWAYGERPELAAVAIDTGAVIATAQRLQHTIAAVKRTIADLPHIGVTYAELVGREGGAAQAMPDGVAERICTFLDVPIAPMQAPFFRKVSWPWPAQLTNWSEVAEAAMRAGMTAMAEELADG